jgi:hypothetical protein
MQTLRGALRTTLLFAAWAGCASATPTAPTTAAIAAPTPTPTAAPPPPDAPTAAAPALPEPSCPPDSQGAVRFYACGDPRPEESPGGLPAPYERCPATRAGRGFSASQTAQRRGQVEQAQTCCYLERCQISYGY